MISITVFLKSALRTRQKLVSDALKNKYLLNILQLQTISAIHQTVFAPLSKKCISSCLFPVILEQTADLRTRQGISDNLKSKT